MLKSKLSHHFSDRIQTTALLLSKQSRFLGYNTPALSIDEGLVPLVIRHTSASLVIQEKADPDVQDDLERFFARLFRDGDPRSLHRSEGPDDTPAHVRAALTAMQISVLVSGGELVLGTWQGIYLWEHRTRAHRREIVVHILGE